MNETTYHAVFAVGHFARRLQARTHGRRGSFHAIAVLQMLWLRTDQLAEAPIVQVDLDDLAGIVSSPERLRQVTSELVEIGAVERIANQLTRSLRLIKPSIEDLDATARTQLELAAARAELARIDLERAQQLNGFGVTPQPSTTKTERANVLTKLRKKPSDVRDVLVSMAGISPASLRYSGAGSGPVQAAIAWLAESGATWEGFVLLCEHAKQDPARPTRDLVWLFGEQHQAYRDRAVALLRDQPAQPSAPASAAVDAELSRPRDKTLGEMSRVDVDRWLKHQVKDESAIASLWENETAATTLLGLTGLAATSRIQAWRADQSRPLAEHFA